MTISNAEQATAAAHVERGMALIESGRYVEARAEFERALELDPRNAAAWNGLGRVHYNARQVELGDAQGGHRTAGYAYMRLGRPEEAMAHLEAAIAAAPDDYEVRGALAGLYRQAGRTAEADEHYRMARAQAEADGEYGLACLASVSGETDQALELLEMGLAKGQVQRGWANIDPEFAFIADDPRFKTLVGA